MMYEQPNHTFALTDILETLGFHPVKDRGRDLFYRSPFRRERTPTFHVDRTDNLWYDFGGETGGDVVDFARAFLASRGLGVSRNDAVCFLGETGAGIPPQTAFNRACREEVSRLRIAHVSRRLEHRGLIRYLTDQRKIPFDLARKYLVEVRVRNSLTGDTFHALGMKNDDGGYAVHNRHFTGTVGRPDVTVIRGRRIPAREVHVFEDFMDMLSALADQRVSRFDGDMIVLHRPCCLSKSLAYVEGYEPYRRLFSWLDNDRAGEKASAIFKRVAGREGQMDVCEMNATYAPFNDVNDCRAARLGLHPFG